MPSSTSQHASGCENHDVDPIERRIAGFRPAKQDRRDALGDAGLEIVRDAVRATSPATVGEASRLLCHTADHVARALGAGHPARPSVLFSARVVEESVAALRMELGSKASPFIAHVDRVARAVCPKGGHPPATTIPQAPLKAPYSRDEQRALLAAAAGMQPDQRQSYLAGLALGFGAGLTGPAAHLPTTAFVERDGHLLVRRGDGTVIAVLERWAEVLRGPLLDRAPGMVTDIYTSAGRQRFARAMRRASGIPHFDPDRLRTTWVCELLAGGVPVDVVAFAAGVKPWSIAGKYMHFIESATDADVWRWMARSGRAQPPTYVRAPVHSRTSGGTRRFTGRTAADALAAYTPSSTAVAEVWSGPLGEELRDLALAGTDDPDRALRLASAVAALVGWALDQPEIPLRVTSLLRDTTIERFSMLHARSAPARAASYRSLLRTLSAADGARPAATMVTRGAYAAPYDAEEIDGLWHAADLRDDDQRYLDTVLVCGVGAGGTGAELKRLRATDLHGHAKPAVRLSDRVVPVPQALETTWERIRRIDAVGTLLGSVRHQQGARHRIAQRTGIEIDPGRCRATWIAHHLERGVPLHVVTVAAGAKLAQLNSIVETLPARDPAEVLGWLSAGATREPAV